MRLSTIFYERHIFERLCSYKMSIVFDVLAGMLLFLYAHIAIVGWRVGCLVGCLVGS